MALIGVNVTTRRWRMQALRLYVIGYMLANGGQEPPNLKQLVRKCVRVEHSVKPEQEG